ncbi:MAG TPA: hypothetical protein ENH62_07690 [Marinobacter sp.]|uniref:Uncharacterized protein n=1 Tax=marine sediment metagenome TaxID=412755 RepID=A0A0F9U3Z1_9ZZZZ|nr:hypothetical protein [Marinobacter sp.]
MPDRTHADKMKSAPPAYDELLASHELLLDALDNLLIYTGGFSGADARGAAIVAQEILTQAKSLQGGK